MSQVLFFMLSISLFTVSCNKSGGGDSAPAETSQSAVIPVPVPTPVTPDPPTDPNTCEIAGAIDSTKLNGLKPLTASEISFMEKTHGVKKIKGIRPNALGLSRMKSNNKTAAPAGEDTAVEEEVDYGGALPTSVDNSTLPAFPAIGSQTLNSCVGWAMGYYQFSHNTGLAMGWNNKTTTSKRCSPKFVYNMINDGLNNGSYFSDAFSMMQKHGCIPNDNFPEDGDYRGWNTNPDLWRSALSFRTNTVQYVNNIDTTAGVEQMKQLLTNGYVLTYGTYIDSWQYTTIKANPASASNPLAGQHVLLYMNGSSGGHAMTIVGYDDTAWTDINSNNAVDNGELGVFKVANSWGTNWKNKGYIFVPYDALKAVSGVSGGPSAGRKAAFMSNMVYHLPVKASGGVAYTPKLLAKFTLNHSMRNQMSLKFGSATSSSTAASSTITPFAMMNKGGGNPFSGTVVMDVTDLPVTSSTDKSFYLTVTDNASGSAATVSSFEIIDVVNTTQSAADLSTAVTADAGSKTIRVNFATAIPNSAPIAKISVSQSTGISPLTTNFDASASTDSDGTISSYSWAFGDGTSATGAYVTKTFSRAGTFTATVTVRDSDGATSSASRVITVTAPVTEPDTCN